MARTAVLGLPRIGPNRELKSALEAYWAERIPASELADVARTLRAAGWRRASGAGVDVIPSGDFSFYDHVLDTVYAVGAVPERFGGPDAPWEEAYFAMARGTAGARPLEMTKWFDTNYHHLVPELSAGQTFRLRAEHWLEPLAQAAALGIATRPVVLGPATFLLLSKGLERPLDALDELVPVYEELLRALVAAGAREVQIDEPCLALDRTPDELALVLDALRALAGAADAELSLATYFAGLGPALADVLALPVA
jgi:5-methyltetrahydropteroyltriglutamate--homocysteine methyltransferase